jgi:broad specificity phosphatase PhoE
VSRVFIWRHGQTEWNATKRVQGHSDVALNAVGSAQAATAAAALAALHPDVIVSSDLRRAADTAAALAAATDLPVHRDPRLRERYFGAWQGMSAAEIALAYPTENARWRRGEPDLGHDIETIDDLAKRVAAGVQDAMAMAGDGTVVVVTHGGSAKYAVRELLGWPDDVIRRLGVLWNCHWTELEHDVHRGWLLRAHNVGGARS